MPKILFDERSEQTPQIVGRTLGVAELFRNFRGILRRRLPSMLLVAAIIFGIAMAFILTMTPRYEAVVRIRIDPKLNPLATAQDSNPAALNAEAIETEISVMKSLDLARIVTKKLGLERDPEFAAQTGPETSAANAQARLNATARRVSNRLTVNRDKLSYVITLSFPAKEPQKAAKIVNAFADSYLDRNVGSQMSTSQRQADFFRERLDEMAKEVNVADAKLASYRAAAGISGDGAGASVLDQQIAPLSTQLATAEAAAAEARAKAAVAVRQRATGGVSAVSEVRNSGVIADLSRQRTEILRSQGEVLARYGAKHPESIRVTGQLATIDKQIADEAQRTVAALQSDAAAADAQVNSLRSAMASLSGQRASQTRATASADALARDAEAKRAAYDRMSQLSLSSTQASRSSIAQAEIVDRAQPGSTASANKKALLSGLALISSLAIGFAYGMSVELLQGGVRSIDDVQDYFDLPVLASVPYSGSKKLLGMRRGNELPADSLLRTPASAYGEALRTARAALVGTDSRTAPKVIALLSALPGEGKTTTALALGRMLAINDSRVLIIDGDLRRAGMREVAQQSPEKGLLDILTADLPPEQAIERDQVDGLDLILVSKPHFTPKDLFSGEAMANLMRWARARYDIVLIDSPPILGLADARTLALIADTSVMAVRWGKTPPMAVETGLAALRADGVHIAGVMLTMVDPNSEAAGGMYYSGKYSKYYQPA